MLSNNFFHDILRSSMDQEFEISNIEMMITNYYILDTNFPKLDFVILLTQGQHLT